MLTDASKDFTDTWTFLDKRLDDIVFANKLQADAEQVVSVAASSLISVIAGLTGASSPRTGSASPREEEEIKETKREGVKEEIKQEHKE
jgi:hypothetical protein